MYVSVEVYIDNVRVETDVDISATSFPLRNSYSGYNTGSSGFSTQHRITGLSAGSHTIRLDYKFRGVRGDVFYDLITNGVGQNYPTGSFVGQLSKMIVVENKV